MQLGGLNTHILHIVVRPGNNAAGLLRSSCARLQAYAVPALSRAGSDLTLWITRQTCLLTRAGLSMLQAPEKIKEGDVFKGSHDRQAAAMERSTATAGNPTESAQVGRQCWQ